MVILGSLNPGDVFMFDLGGVLWMVMDHNEHLEPKPRQYSKLVLQITTASKLNWTKSKAGTPWYFGNDIKVIKCDSPFNVNYEDTASKKLLAIQNIINQ